MNQSKEYKAVSMTLMLYQIFIRFYFFKSFQVFFAERLETRPIMQHVKLSFPVCLGDENLKFL